MPDAKAPAAQTRAPISTKTAVGGGLAACAAACMAIAISLVKPSEGKWNVAKRDFARGIPTACFGHTGPDVRLGQRYTDAECETILSADVVRVRDAVAACVPGLRSRSGPWAGSTSMAYNIGPKAFCGSSTARAFNASQWRVGCDAMLRWDKAVVGGKLLVVPGLLARRQRERAQCLAGVVT